MSPSGVQTDTRVRTDSGRDGTGLRSTSRSLPPPVPATEVLLRRDRLAARIAANCVEQIDQLSLIGYPSLEPAHRAVVEQTIRLVARRVIES